MLKKVKKTIKNENLIKKNETVLIGVSGGADSMSLFDILMNLKEELKINILVAHVHHGLRDEEAERDMNFVEKICNENSIDFFKVRYDIKKEASNRGLTEEEAGRLLRYEFFNKIAKSENVDKIAVAHNKNDDVETFFMRLFRGTGPRGLKGILNKRGNIIRPILNCTREEIEKYCEENRVSYIVDSSNLENDYTRNKIRNKLIPYLEDHYDSNLIGHISKAIRHIKEQEEYIESITEDFFVKTTNENFIKINKVIEHDEFMQKRIIMKMLEKLDSIKDVREEHFNFILKLMKKQSGKKYHLPNGMMVRKSFNKLIFENKNKTRYTKKSYSLKFDEINVFEDKKIKLKKIKKVKKEDLNYKYILDYDKINCELEYRNRKNGDRFGSKKLKSYLINKKIDKKKREKIFFIADGKNILIFDEKVNSKYKPTENTKNLLIIEEIE